MKRWLSAPAALLPGADEAIGIKAICRLWVISGHGDRRMSVLPPQANIAENRGDVRFMPIADLQPQVSIIPAIPPRASDQGEESDRRYKDPA
jgi:hypothetical protein